MENYNKSVSELDEILKFSLKFEDTTCSKDDTKVKIEPKEDENKKKIEDKPDSKRCYMKTKTSKCNKLFIDKCDCGTFVCLTHNLHHVSDCKHKNETKLIKVVKSKIEKL